MAIEIVIYIDGSCPENPGHGGWGALVSQYGREEKFYGGELNTTNNRMEMMAAIKILEKIGNTKKTILMVTDSQYLKNGITKWIKNWKRRGWKSSDGKPVKNRDLWERLDILCENLDISWTWVRGHSGHRENEMADALANRGYNEIVENLKIVDRLVTNFIDRKPTSIDANFQSMGIETHEIIDLLESVERSFGCEFSTNELENINTINDIIISINDGICLNERS